MDNCAYILSLKDFFGVETNRDLAEIVGYSEDYISMVANNKRNLSEKFVRKVNIKKEHFFLNTNNYQTDIEIYTPEVSEITKTKKKG